MYGLLLSAMLVAPQNADNVSPERTVSLDGNWTVVCCEKDGQPAADAKKMTCSIRNNTVTCTSDKGSSDLKTMKLEFGPQATIRIKELDASGKVEKTKTGVCVVAKDYLAICVHDDSEGTRTSLKPNENFTDKPQTKTHCTLFLKRTE